MADLTPKQERFVEEYLVDLNATQAAIRAGYSFENKENCNHSYYVYFLVDPSTDDIFYVGKGKGKRSFAHEKQVRAGIVDNAKKSERIRKIIKKGQSVKVVFFYKTKSENSAYTIERLLIQKLKKSGVCNVSNGNTSQAEKNIIKAKVLLQNLLPFDVWIKQAKPLFEQGKLFLGRHKNLEDLYFSVKKGLEEISKMDVENERAKA